MSRFAIILPIVTAGFLQRDAAEDGDAVVHPLAVQRMMNIAARGEEVGRKHLVFGLGLLKAENVGLLLVEESADDRHTGPDGVDVPAGDLEFAHHPPLASPCPETQRPPLRGHGARADQAFVTRGTSGEPGNRGKPKLGPRSEVHLALPA